MYILPAILQLMEKGIGGGGGGGGKKRNNLKISDVH